MINGCQACTYMCWCTCTLKLGLVRCQSVGWLPCKEDDRISYRDSSRSCCFHRGFCCPKRGRMTKPRVSYFYHGKAVDMHRA